MNASAQKEGAFQPTVWFEITPDNLVTVTIPGSEMGQGIRTALPMIDADEMEADWKQVRIMQSPADDPYKNTI
jgi:isoquinoline 1-oxidoreductase beta subunit